MAPNEINDIIKQLSDPNPIERLNAVQLLENLGPDARDALDQLWNTAITDHQSRVRNGAIKAILVIDDDKAKLLSNAIKELEKGDAFGRQSSISIILELQSILDERDVVLNLLWKLLKNEEDSDLIEDTFEAIIKISRDNQKVLARLITAEIGSATKSHLIVLGELRDELNKKWRNDSEKTTLLTIIVETLRDKKSEVRDVGLAWLTEKTAEIPLDLHKLVIDALWEYLELYGRGIDALHKLGGDQVLEQAISGGKHARSAIGRYILTKNPDVLKQRWAQQSDREVLLNLLLNALEDDTWKERYIASHWMTQNIEEIPLNLYEAVLKALDVRLQLDPDADVRQSIGQLVSQIKVRQEQKERSNQIAPWIEIVRNGDEDAQLEALSTLIKMNNRVAFRALIQEWTQWILLGQNTRSVELVADAIRSSWLSVLPIINRLGQNNSVQVEGTQLGSKTLNKKVIVEQELSNKRELTVQRRIARQLAEMSAPRFFDGKQDEYELVRKELDKHAIPLIVRRFPQESDLDIRESLAHVLGNIGGREAIESLAQAVVGNERTRAERQALLSTYYLEPSRIRSEQAASILTEAVTEAKRTLWLIQRLNLAVFIIGFIMILGGLTLAIFTPEASARWAGALAGIGGFAGIMVQLIRDPLDRIQTAMARLVQLETAFTNFIWELNLNGTYIQSQYVAEGVLTDDEISRTVKRMETAIELAMRLVETYTNKSK